MEMIKKIRKVLKTVKVALMMNRSFKKVLNQNKMKTVKMTLMMIRSFQKVLKLKMTKKVKMALMKNKSFMEVLSQKRKKRILVLNKKLIMKIRRMTIRLIRR